MKNIMRLLLAFFLPVMLTVACGSSDSLGIQEAWARPAAAGSNSAAYFRIENHTKTEDVLLSAETDIATAELHLSSMDENGVMSMQKQASVPVPAAGNLEFKPGGLHIMLIGLRQDLKPGDTVALTLKFEKTGNMTVQVPVREP
jgi:periplasmic copper chaperone A